MKEITIKNIKFSTYFKLHMILGLTSGISLAIIMLILSFISGDSVSAHFFQLKFTGILAGIMGLWIAPIVTLLGAFFIAIFSYPGFKLFMKLKKQFKLKLDVEEEL